MSDKHDEPDLTVDTPSHTASHTAPRRAAPDFDAQSAPAAPSRDAALAAVTEQPRQRWSLVQEYARTPGRKLLRAGAHLRREVREWLGTSGIPTVMPYIGYGSSAGGARIFARVLELSEAPSPSVEDSVFTNFKRSYYQWKTSELPGKRVRVTCGGRSVIVESDAEGYIDALFDAPSLDAPWSPVQFTLQEPGSTKPIEGQLYVPPMDTSVGILSDIDDTILHTEVQDRVRMVALSVFGNALTRMGYDGTTEWYQGLVKKNRAAMFYVSRSAWNLFPLLRGFIEHQGLPLGPLLLRDVGLRRGKERRKGHKFRRMSEILEMFPHMRFVCIGDSGQRDPEIYAALAKRYRGRVLAIYIRDVGNPERRRLAEAECERCGLPFLVFEHSRDAMTHAHQLGLWSPP